jgi:hypothetical protein
MPQLIDLDVDYVSLVDVAAVRDPQRKSEPRRFLLRKREGADTPIPQDNTEENTMAAATATNPVGDALRILRPLADEDDDVAAICVALEGITPGGDDEAGEAALEKAMAGMTRARSQLQKSATRDPGLLGRIDKVSADLQRRYLSKHQTAYGNPEVARFLP